MPLRCVVVLGGSRTGGKRSASARVALTVVALVAGLLAPSVSHAAPGLIEPTVVPPAPGAGLAHPRVLYSPGQERALAARLTREPYRRVFLDMASRVSAYTGRTVGDPSIAAQRDL